jgi:hypothetical protein
LTPCLHLAAESAARHRQRRAALGLGFGREQIGQAFGFRQVDSAMVESSAGELARLRRTQPVQPGQRLQHGGDHRPAAVQVKLRHILARGAVRPREAQDERTVEPLALPFQIDERRHPRLGQLSGQRLERRVRVKSADSHHRQRRGRASRRQREDRVAHVQVHSG